MALSSAGLGAACTGDGVVQPFGPELTVCHTEASVPKITKILLSELAGHRSHGDYVTQLEVSKSNSAGDSIHFTRITDALAVARAGRIARSEVEKAACRITILVAAGTVSGSTAPSSDPAVERFPLVIDVPDITLKGALKMPVDAAGRAVGAGILEATTFVPNPAVINVGSLSQGGFAEQIIIVNGHPDGPKGHGTVIEGFVFRSGRASADTILGGQGVSSWRVRDLVILGNQFLGGFASSMDLVASSARVERNNLFGPGSSCDVCLAGPGDYVARDNRIVGGGIPGILVFPTVGLGVPPGVEAYVLPATSLVTALIVNNEVRDHVRRPVGVGFRVGAIGVGASSVVGTSRVTLSGNNMVNNMFGMLIEGAFINPTDATRRRGNIEVTTSGNTFSRNCQADVLVALSSSQTAIGLATLPPLVNSNYNISFGADISFDRSWFSHPAGTGNTLVVNGQTIANGSRVAYDAARPCTADPM